MNTLHEYLFTFMYLVGTLDRLYFFRCKAKKKEFMIIQSAFFGLGRGNLSRLVLDKYLRHNIYHYL